MTKACQPYGPLVITIFNASELYSPNDYDNPGYYPINLNCTWKVIGVRNKMILIEFEESQNNEIEEK